jgi:ribonuclease D
MPEKPTSPQRRGRGPGRRHAETHDGEPIIITSAADLRKVCKELREVGTFAFDTEFVMEDVFRPEVCVVQLATETMTAILDPFEVRDLHCVWELIGDPAIEVVVHAGMEDLAICFEQGGVTPQNVFDCQIACGLVKSDYPLSLARLARFLLGVRLKKSQTLTDWRKRPLSEAQVRYAADDVRYLPAARRELGRKLLKHKRTAWAAEEMARFSKPETYVRGTVESVLKLKGAGGLDGEGLAIAHELLAERAKLAARYNRPARAVVRDHLLIEIARHRWTDPAQIKTLRGLNLRAQAVDALAQAVRRASALPPEEWPTPTPPSDETEREAALALLASAIIHGYCAEADIAHQLVAAKKDVRIFVRALVRGEDCPAGVALARGWRAEHIGLLVREVFAGRRSAGVIADNGGPYMVVK